MMIFGRVARAVERQAVGVLDGVGKRAFFLRDMMRGLREPGTWIPETIRQMRVIGVESVPLAVIVAAFLGGVTAFQTRYQLFPGVQVSVVGLIARQSIVLELGPLLTALVLTGRVGARMTAEIGTMRVTEQIDALETLSFDPIGYLALPLPSPATQKSRGQQPSSTTVARGICISTMNSYRPLQKRVLVAILIQLETR